jgi:hypothetical protein
MFLMGAAAVEVSAWSLGGLMARRAAAISDDGAISVRRLVNHLPTTPMLPGDPR